MIKLVLVVMLTACGSNMELLAKPTCMQIQPSYNSRSTLWLPLQGACVPMSREGFRVSSR
jgi:hypothetical protein